MVCDNCLIGSMIVSEYILFLILCNNVINNIEEKNREKNKGSLI